ncbi:MAG: hypothetical protein V4671_30535 [Armatimonadota bacterium]
MECSEQSAAETSQEQHKLEDTPDSEAAESDISWYESIPPLPRPLTTKNGLKLLVVVSLFAAVALGTIWHLGGRFFDLIFLTPLFAGFFLAFAMEKAISKTCWRRSVTILWLSAIAAVLLLATRYVEDSIAARPMVIRSLSESFSESEHLPPAVVHSQLEQQMTPLESSLIYIVAIANRGTYVSRDLGVTYLMSGGTRISGIPFRGYGFWLLLLFQAAVIVGVCMIATDPTIHSGYCNTCGKWAKRHWLFRKQGHQADELADYVRGQRWAEADDMRLGGKISGKDFSTAHLLHCANCASDMLIVNRMTHGEEKHLLYARISSETAESIRSAVRRVA